MGTVVDLAAAIALGVVAVGLVTINWNHRPSRAYAALLALQASMLATGGLSLYPDNIRLGTAMGYMHPYFVIALPFAAIHFAGIYLKPSWPRWFPLFAAPPLAAYAFNHSLYWDLSAATWDIAHYGDELVTKGAMFLLFRAVEISAAVVAVIFLLRARTAAPLDSRATALVSLGFFVPAACTCAIADFLRRVQIGTLFAGSNTGMPTWIAITYDALLLLQLALLALMIVVALRMAKVSGPIHGWRRSYVWFLLATMLSMLPILAMPTETSQIQAMFALWGFWALTGALLVAYGMLKYRVLDLDLRCKTGIRRTTVASIIALSALVGSETLERALEIDSVLAAIFIGGLVSLAVRPLSRVGERLAARAIPGVADTPEYREERARQMVQAAFESASRGGAITRPQRDAITALAKSLNVDPPRFGLRA